MKFSDFLIDLNDIYGRLIPGIFLIIDLYLIFHFFTPIRPEQILEYLKEHSSLSVSFILMFLIVSHIVGELSINLIFRLKRFLIKKTPLEILKELDVTKGKELTTFFESKFGKDALNSKSPLMGYCKDYLLENSFQAYTQTRKIEARINLRGGMVMPLSALGVICLFYLCRHWFFTVLAVLAFVLAVLFFDKFRTSFKYEDEFIYKAYYNCWTKTQRISSQSLTSSEVKDSQ